LERSKEEEKTKAIDCFNEAGRHEAPDSNDAETTMCAFVFSLALIPEQKAQQV